MGRDCLRSSSSLDGQNGRGFLRMRQARPSEGQTSSLGGILRNMPLLRERHSGNAKETWGILDGNTQADG